MNKWIRHMKKLAALLLLFTVVLSSCKNETNESQSSEIDVFNEKYKVEEDFFSAIGYYRPEEKLKTLCDNPYLSNEDRENIEATMKISEEFPLIVGVDYKLSENSFEEPDIRLEIEMGLATWPGSIYSSRWDHCSPEDITEKYYLESEGEIQIEIRNRIGILWLNGEIDDLYSYSDFVDTRSSLEKEICVDSSPDSAEPFCIISKEVIQKWDEATKDLKWFQKVCSFSYESSASAEDMTSDNLRLYLLMYDYYLSVNTKLEESVGEIALKQYYEWQDEAMYGLFQIYKDYGEKMFDPAMYDEIFADYDKQIMDYFGINVDQMR